MIWIYLKGLGIIALMVAWIVFFNWAWRKVTKEPLGDNIFAMVFGPFLIPLAIVLIACVPFMLGMEGY